MCIRDSRRGLRVVGRGPLLHRRRGLRADAPASALLVLVGPGRRQPLQGRAFGGRRGSLAHPPRGSVAPA
eukprot:11989773-Alexandrium_andersonii.AAC.1